MAKKLKTDSEVVLAIQARIQKNRTELDQLDQKIRQKEDKYYELNASSRELQDEIQKLKQKKIDLPKKIEDDESLLE